MAFIVNESGSKINPNLSYWQLLLAQGQLEPGAADYSESDAQPQTIRLAGSLA
jgi:hypothetical protein